MRIYSIAIACLTVVVASGCAITVVLKDPEPSAVLADTFDFRVGFNQYSAMADIDNKAHEEIKKVLIARKYSSFKILERACRNDVVAWCDYQVQFRRGEDVNKPDVTAQRKPIPVTEAVPAFDAGWASVAPPRGNDWYFIDGDLSGAVFGKRISSRHSFMAIVLVRKLENCCKDAQELVAVLRANHEKDRQDPRYRVVTQEAQATSWAGLVCVSHRLVSEDRGSTIAPGVPLNFFQKGISCLRPGFTGEAIDVTYSERGGEPEGSPELVAEGESFLKGLKRSENR